MYSFSDFSCRLVWAKSWSLCWIGLISCVMPELIFHFYCKLSEWSGQDSLYSISSVDWFYYSAKRQPICQFAVWTGVSPFAIWTGFSLPCHHSSVDGEGPGNISVEAHQWKNSYASPNHDPSLCTAFTALDRNFSKHVTWVDQPGGNVKNSYCKLQLGCFLLVLISFFTLRGKLWWTPEGFQQLKTCQIKVVCQASHLSSVSF